MKNYILFLALGISLIASSCYSFRGISIPESIKTFNLPYVELHTPDAPVGINLDFQDKMLEKITRESRLIFEPNSPDITLKASISRYSVESIAPNANNQSEANRLVVEVTVDYEDSQDDKNNWRQKFNNNREFAAGLDLLSIQDELISEIFDNIIEDIFNKAFTNW